MVGGLALAAAIIAEVRYKNLGKIETAITEWVSRINDQDDLFLKLEAMCGLVFGTTGVSVLVGFGCLVGRIFIVEKSHPFRIIISLVMLCAVIASYCERL